MNKKFLYIVLTVTIVTIISLILYLSLNSKPSNKAQAQKKDETFYDCFQSLPLSSMQYIDDETYKFLRSFYGDVNFYGEFSKGNIENYEFFKKKYHQLLNNEVPFYNRKTQEEYYLNELEFLSTFTEGMLNLNEFNYVFFDINEDDVPELMINSGGLGYVFLYNSNLDKFFLWYSMDSYYYTILGSKKIAWTSSGLSPHCTFYELNEDGEVLYSLRFSSQEVYDESIDETVVSCVVTLPSFVGKDQHVNLSKNMKKQAYSFLNNIDVAYGFRVTEDQYNELTNDYFHALKLAEKKIDEVKFSYSELFK